MGILGSQVFSDPDPDEPRVLDIEGADAERTFDALGSETARSILAATYDEPRTPPEIRDTVGTSLQNVHYHIERLEDADLIESVGTGYSEKGNEMSVYAPCSEALVLFAGDERGRGRLESFLSRVLSAYLLLATLTAAVAVFTRRVTQQAADLSTAGGDIGTAETTARETAPGLFPFSLSDPAVMFFVGGLVTLTALSVVWWLRQ